jgi:hypothetical protein
MKLEMSYLLIPRGITYPKRNYIIVGASAYVIDMNGMVASLFCL